MCVCLFLLFNVNDNNKTGLGGWPRTKESQPRPLPQLAKRMLMGGGRRRGLWTSACAGEGVGGRGGQGDGGTAEGGCAAGEEGALDLKQKRKLGVFVKITFLK